MLVFQNLDCLSFVVCSNTTLLKLQTVLFLFFFQILRFEIGGAAYLRMWLLHGRLRYHSLNVQAFFDHKGVSHSRELGSNSPYNLNGQQCVGDLPRSVLSIAKTAEGYAEEAAEEKLNTCIERLCAEFSDSKEDKCRQLAIELSATKQEHSTSVERFAFKYKKTTQVPTM